MNALAEDQELAVGRRLGRYEICAKLASGGMATVYLARATGPAGFDKLVALKVVHPRLATQSEFIEMFLDEARIASRITHANVGSVFDVGEEAGTFYLAMDYLHGESLASVLGRVATQPQARATHLYPILVTTILAAACEGLHVAHELRGDDGTPLNVVHRDVSPHNIFVTYDGGVRVVDFGIARAAGRLHKTLSGTIKGKVAYMPPEQLRGDDLDRRADLWAIGVTLWELLACRRLFRRESQGKTIDAVLTGFIPAVSTFAPNLPPGLDDVVASALSRDPAERPKSARELGRALRRVVASTGEVMGMAELAEWMESLFAEHREAKQRMIDAARSGTRIERVPDTERFARVEADMVPTAVEEGSDIRAKAREGMDTLREGGMGERPKPTTLETAIERLPPAPTASEAEPAPEAPVASPAQRADPAPVHSTRPAAYQTESVVLPTHGKPRSAIIALAAVVLLAAVGGAAFFATRPSPSPTPSPGPSPAPTPPPSQSRSPSPTPSPRPTPPASASTDAPREHVQPHPAQSTQREPDPSPENLPSHMAATPPPTPPSPSPGRLSLGVRGGWGTFVVDGSQRGDTPRELTLPPGRHRVVIRPFGDGAPIRRSVVVRSGETTRVTVDAP